MVSAQLFIILRGVDSGEDVICRISGSEATANWAARRRSERSEAQPGTDMLHTLRDGDDSFGMRIGPLGVLAMIYRGLKDSDAEEVEQIRNKRNGIFYVYSDNCEKMLQYVSEQGRLESSMKRKLVGHKLVYSPGRSISRD